MANESGSSPEDAVMPSDARSTWGDLLNAVVTQVEGYDYPEEGPLTAPHPDLVLDLAWGAFARYYYLYRSRGLPQDWKSTAAQWVDEQIDTAITSVQRIDTVPEVELPPPPLRQRSYALSIGLLRNAGFGYQTAEFHALNFVARLHHSDSLTTANWEVLTKKLEHMVEHFLIDPLAEDHQFDFEKFAAAYQAGVFNFLSLETLENALKEWLDESTDNRVLWKWEVRRYSNSLQSDSY